MEWIEALPSQVDTHELPTLERRKKLVDNACELMLGHTDEPLSILEVCSHLGDQNWLQGPSIVASASAQIQSEMLHVLKSIKHA